MDLKSALYDIFNDSHDATERKTCSFDLQASNGHFGFPGWKHVSSFPVFFTAFHFSVFSENMDTDYFGGRLYGVFLFVWLARDELDGRLFERLDRCCILFWLPCNWRFGVA